MYTFKMLPKNKRFVKWLRLVRLFNIKLGHPLNDQQGEFGGGNNHVLTCGKGTGLFMLIRSNEPLYRYEHYPKLYEACSGIMISARQKHAATSFK